MVQQQHLWLVQALDDPEHIGLAEICRRSGGGAFCILDAAARRLLLGPLRELEIILGVCCADFVAQLVDRPCSWRRAALAALARRHRPGLGLENILSHFPLAAFPVSLLLLQLVGVWILLLARLR